MNCVVSVRYSSTPKLAVVLLENVDEPSDILILTEMACAAPISITSTHISGIVFISISN